MDAGRTAIRSGGSEDRGSGTGGRARAHSRRAQPEGGGVWIATGLLLGLLAYGGVLLMLVAGYTAVLPLAVVPLVLVGLIAAANLLGGRSYGQTAGPRAVEGQSPVPSSGMADPGGLPTAGSGAPEVRGAGRSGEDDA